MIIHSVHQNFHLSQSKRIYLRHWHIPSPRVPLLRTTFVSIHASPALREKTHEFRVKLNSTYKIRKNKVVALQLPLRVFSLRVRRIVSCILGDFGPALRRNATPDTSNYRRYTVKEFSTAL